MVDKKQPPIPRPDIDLMAGEDPLWDTSDYIAMWDAIRSNPIYREVADTMPLFDEDDILVEVNRRMRVLWDKQQAGAGASKTIGAQDRWAAKNRDVASAIAEKAVYCLMVDKPDSAAELARCVKDHLPGTASDQLVKLICDGVMRGYRSGSKDGAPIHPPG